ncbi:helix-turn-helix domain-containing protein [Paenibacillus monticola]|uniref:Helix-turn-helix domain-containing protein n=1 Tax=Paenibacillus monticola TaxID=2666075 RepID=A0A7X2H6N5_9BACL|nr:AraC family transcriptional regulator [Paenibacillus monticola]MRN53778.1 helix-turn-helix domain-containing protein [Paenibacillus monticola]
MRTKTDSKFAFNALFVKLMLSFLGVILLLASFNLFSHIYLSKKVYQEMVRQNELGLQQTALSYENHFRLTQNIILALNQSAKWTANLGLLSHIGENRRYDVVSEVKSDLVTIYSNPFLHIENFILYFKEADYVLEKDGTSRMNDMFSKYYASKEYPPEYWRQQTMDKQYMKILPAADFTETTMNSMRPLGSLLPLVVEVLPYKEVYGIVMLNARELQTAYGDGSSNPFYILDSNGDTLFSTSIDHTPPGAVSGNGSYHKQVGDQYYFYQKGGHTGFTYVRVTPAAAITSGMRQMQLLLAALLTAAVLASILCSLFFSFRLNQPLQRLIAALERKSGAGAGKLSSVKEFAIIGDRMSRILETNQFIQTDLEHKNSLVRQYAYSHKVKNIPLNPNLLDLEDTQAEDQPYAAVLFKLSFKQPSQSPEKDTLMLWQLIQRLFLGNEGDMVAVQPEQNQLLLLLFRCGPQSGILQTLQTLKELLEEEPALYLTIAVSPVYSGETPITDAYGSLSSLLKERRLNKETQIIVEPRASSARSFHVKVTHGEELSNLLLSGNEEAVLGWLDRQLEQLNQKDAAAEDFRAFAAGAVEQAGKTVMKLGLREDVLIQPVLKENFENFYSTGQYRAWLHALVRPILADMRTKSETKDPVLAYVLDYLDKHYGENINLNLVADKLNLSPGYLSTFFKEKQGINFSDYLNNLRIGHAKELLMNLDLRIQEIALQVGYLNVNSFIRMFKRASGLTPGEYRKSHASGTPVSGDGPE